MEIILEIIKYLFYVLVFPGFLFCFFLGLLLAGIDRKVVARMQRRIGPPIMQPFYDFFKLIGKEHIIPRGAARRTFLIAPVIGLVSIVIISLFIPIFGYTFISNAADIVVIIYLLTIPAVALILGGASSGSPYAGVGVSREMVTMLSYELPLVIVFLAVGAKVGHAMSSLGNVTFSLQLITDYQALNGVMLLKWSMIPAALAYLLIIPAEVGSVPFDVAEAETEICEGPLIEYSGFYLALYKLTQSIKMFIMASIFIALFLGGVGFKNIISNTPLMVGANTLLMIAVVAIVTIVSISFAKAIVARIKIEQTLKFFWTIPTGLALISLVLAYYGL